MGTGNADDADLEGCGGSGLEDCVVRERVQVRCSCCVRIQTLSVSIRVYLWIGRTARP